MAAERDRTLAREQTGTVFVLRGLVAFLLLLTGLWVGYAVSAGYVGVLPVPVNVVAGLASLVILGAVAMRVVVRP